MQGCGCAGKKPFPCSVYALPNLNVAVQFLGISYTVGKEAIGHIQRREGPEEAALLLGIAIASVVVLSILCGLKLDLSVSVPQTFCRLH